MISAANNVHKLCTASYLWDGGDTEYTILTQNHTGQNTHKKGVHIPTRMEVYKELNGGEDNGVVFQKYPKTPHMGNENILYSEKIDGTNGVVYVETNGDGSKKVLAGSRTRWLTPGKQDNHGFAAWVKDNEEELSKLPDGFHYGEWYGKGINHGYGLDDRRFMLFNRSRYEKLENLPKCVELETIVGKYGDLETIFYDVDFFEKESYLKGSWHVPGCMFTEGLILRFTESKRVYKKVWGISQKNKKKS